MSSCHLHQRLRGTFWKARCSSNGEKQKQDNLNKKRRTTSKIGEDIVAKQPLSGLLSKSDSYTAPDRCERHA